MKFHYNLTITGKVQGVFYRDSARNEAKRLGITGFVRNEDNGSVYAECEGEEMILKEFIEWCKVGPSHAKVDEVESETGEMKDFKGFRIERW
jgi:acylphosphatase